MPTPLHPLNDEVYPIPGPRFVSIVALPLDLRDPLDITGLPLDIRAPGDITGLPLDLQNTAEISQNFTAGAVLIGAGTNPIAESAYLSEFSGGMYLQAGLTSGSPAFFVEGDTAASGSLGARSALGSQVFVTGTASLTMGRASYAIVDLSGSSSVDVAVAYHASESATTTGAVDRYVGFAAFEQTRATSNIGLFLGSTSLTLADAPAGDWAIYSKSTRESHLSGPLEFDFGGSSASLYGAADMIHLDLESGAAGVNGAFKVDITNSGQCNFFLRGPAPPGDLFFGADALSGLTRLSGQAYVFPAPGSGGVDDALVIDSIDGFGNRTLAWTTISPGGGGTVTSIAAGSGIALTPDPIVTTGTVAVDATVVRTSRTIATTAPLTGGGDLSANRTLAISDFVASGASHARGAVPDPGSLAGATKFLREDATWALPPVATVTGSGTAGQATFWTTATNISSDAAFLWDNTNKRLGIGGTPSVQFHTTGRASLASSLAEPGTDGLSIVTVGSGTADPVWRYGISQVQAISTLGAGDGFYGYYSNLTHSSAGTPSFVVACHQEAKTTTSIGGVEGIAGVASAINTSGNITLADARGVYASATTGGAGTKTLTEMHCVWAPFQLDTGTATITHAYNFRADNNQSFTGGVGRLTAGVITNLYGYLYNHPTTGTVGNEYAFYSEATKTGAADTSWQTYNAGTYGQTATLGNGGVGTGAKSYFGARVGIGCEDPISQLEVDASGFAFLPRGIFVSQHNTTTAAAPITGVRSRGSRGAPTALASGDYTLVNFGAAYDGAVYQATSYWGAVVDGTVSAAGGLAPQAFVVATGTTEGTLAEHMRVDSVGAITEVSQPGAHAWNTTDQTITTSTLTAVTFDSNLWTQGGATAVHDTAANTSRLTAPVTGIYEAIGQVTFKTDGAGVGIRGLSIRRNGATYIASQGEAVASATLPSVLQVVTLVKMTATDYVEMMVQQQSGGNLDIVGDVASTFCQLLKRV